MKLLGNRFLIKKDEFFYNGKIILIENEYDMHPFSGEIILIGNQIKNSNYNIGDRVIFTELGYEVTDMMKEVDDKGIYVFVEEKDICGKFLSKQC